MPEYFLASILYNDFEENKIYIGGFKLTEEEFVFIAASDESADKIKDYVTTVNYSFQFVKLNRSVFDLEIMALPTTMIINKQGEIIYNEVGARKWNSETELNKLRELANQ